MTGLSEPSLRTTRLQGSELTASTLHIAQGACREARLLERFGQNSFYERLSQVFGLAYAFRRNKTPRGPEHERRSCEAR